MFQSVLVQKLGAIKEPAVGYLNQKTKKFGKKDRFLHVPSYYETCRKIGDF